MTLPAYNYYYLGRSRRARRGMTLVEVMVATTLMIVVVIMGVLSANYIGMREDQLIESQAGASDTSRAAVNQFITDIRNAKGFVIGAATSGTNFTAVANGLAQQGTGLMLYPIINSTNETIDTTKYIIYYFDLSNTNNSDGHLVCYNDTNSGNISSTVIASNLISSYYFSCEDYTGTVQTDRTYKGVIHTTLQFCEFQYPLTKVGSNYLFDYYRIDCRATPHLPDGP